ncbi:MAG: 3-phenylpropionate/trans-cinnamate dioxygenase ferredoxin reductase component [Pseudonocardiales bacterium]|nr:3-phenylpropionate/trans-cinnamate dioxygenase ferredoxin reductase component [Pseudonocardiales bacterium]
MPRYLIIGASAAGFAAARELRLTGFAGELTVVDRDQHAPYERPPLSKQVARGTTPALTPLVDAQTLRELDVELIRGTGVRALDLVGHRVELADGQRLSFDAVLLATGARPRTLAVPGARLEGVLALRDAADAWELSDRLAEGGPLVVVGAGFIGLELASAARTAGVGVTVVEKTAAPLAGTLGSRLSEWLLGVHRGHGVEVILGAEVEAFVGRRRVEEVVLTDGRRLPAGTVLVGIGAEPEVDLGHRAGLRCADGIVVDGYGRTSDPRVFAAGDVACQPHPHLAVPGRIEHWDSALRHGAAVGATMAGRPTLHSEIPYFWSEQYGGLLQSYGRHRPGDDLVIRGQISSDRATAVWLRSGVPVAAVGFGAAREIRAIKTLIEASAPVSVSAIADPMTDFRQLSNRMLTSAPRAF